MLKMTSRQRLLTALRCQEPDRVPIIIRGVNPYARHMNWRGEADPSYRPLIDLVRRYCDVEHLWAAGQGFFFNGAALDIRRQVERVGGWERTTTSIATPLGPLTAISRIGIDSYAHATLKHWISEEEDVARFLSLPFTLVSPDLAPYHTATAEIGRAGYVLPYLDDPIGLVHALLGSETLALWSVMAPELLTALLQVLAERELAYLQALLLGGVTAVVGLQGQETITPPLLSPRRFDELVAPYDVPLIELAHQHDCLVVVHCHGRLDGVIERLTAMGVDALHPVEAPPMGDITLAEARRRVGGRMCLIGNIQIGDLMEHDRSEIVSQTRAAIRDGAPGGGFILSITATPFERMLSPRTLENLRAMIETGLEYGRQM